MQIRTLLLPILLITLFSCDSYNPFEETGEYTEKKIPLDNVTAIKTENTFKVTLVNDDNEFLLLKGGENLISKCTYNLEENTLILNHNHKNSVKNFDLLEAEVHIKTLNKITAEAPSNFTASHVLSGTNLSISIPNEAELVEMNLPLDYNSLHFHSYGSISGGFQFSGSVQKANYILNGICNILAHDLHSEEVRMAQNGIGEAHIWAEKTLSVTIYNTGNIYYKGTPSISIRHVQVNNQSPSAQVLPE